MWKAVPVLLTEIKTLDVVPHQAGSSISRFFYVNSGRDVEALLMQQPSTLIINIDVSVED